MKNLSICKNYCKKAFANDKGVILPTVVVLLIILTLLVFVGAQWAQMDIKRTKNYTKTRQAFYVAETGIEVAMNHLNFSDTGVVGAGSGADGFEDELAHGTTFGANWPVTKFDVDYNDGHFTVTITDNDDGCTGTPEDCDETVLITSVGTKRGKTSTIEATVYRGEGTVNQAFITNNNVTINGDVTINGGAHSNGDATINGGPTINPGPQGLTVNGSCTDPQCKQVSSPETIPDLNMEDYKHLADVVLKDGSPTRFEWMGADIWDYQDSLPKNGDYTFQKISTDVWDGVTFNLDLTPDTTSTVAVTCWKPVIAGVADPSPTRCDGSDPDGPPGVDASDPAQDFYKLVEDTFGSVNQTGNNEWKFNGNKLPQDVYIYVEHKVYDADPEIAIGGKITIGNTPSPWSVSIISTGAINFNGNAILDNYRDKYAPPPANQGDNNIFLFAGSDINGGANAEFTSLTPDGLGGFLATQGLVYAHDQMDFAGDANLEGAVLLFDGYDTPSSVFHGYVGLGGSKLTGSFTVTHVGNLDVPWPGPVKILSWREIAVVPNS